MPSPVTVRYWAGARRAAGRDSEIVEAADLDDLLDQLGQHGPELKRVVLASSILIDGTATVAGQLLPPGAVIDVLPPFAGG
jgi:molybdopterin converting factor small subunit